MEARKGSLVMTRGIKRKKNIIVRDANQLWKEKVNVASANIDVVLETRAC